MKLLNKLRQINKKIMVCYGTSLTSGSGWVKMLGKELPGWCVINSGKGGMNSTWGIDNFEDRVLTYNPHIVLMEFAVNDAYTKEDFYRRSSFTESLANIRNMISRLRCEVYYMTMNPPLDMFIQGRNPAEDRPYWRDYYKIHRRVAHEMDAKIINITSRWQVLDTEDFLRYAPDGLHPNELASREITIPTILEALCLE